MRQSPARGPFSVSVIPCGLLRISWAASGSAPGRCHLGRALDPTTGRGPMCLSAQTEGDAQAYSHNRLGCEAKRNMLETKAPFLGEEREIALLAAMASLCDHLDSPRIVKCEE